jgi:DNA-binding transcriptional LysR family regulator
VRLSGAGERLLPEAYAVLAAADRAWQVAADIASGHDGVLRLGTVQGPGDRIYRMVGELAARTPKLQVQLQRLPVSERLAAVRTGELDAALVRAASAARGLELLEVWRDPLYAALPADHPLADRPVLGLDVLSALPLRLAPREHNAPFHDLVRRALQEIGAEPPQGPPFTDLQATLTAIGVAVEPSWTVFYEVGALPQMPRVALRPLTAPSVTTSLAVPPGSPTPPVLGLLQVLHTIGPTASAPDESPVVQTAARGGRGPTV